MADPRDAPPRTGAPAVHLWQQNFGQHPVTRNYHNREFVGKCEQLGLHPRVGTGAHWKPADGAFAQLMAENQIQRPTQVVVPKEERKNWWDLGKKERKGRSTLSKWSCGCQNVRVGTKEFHARCTRCGKISSESRRQPIRFCMTWERRNPRRGPKTSGYDAQRVPYYKHDSSLLPR